MKNKLYLTLIINIIIIIITAGCTYQKSKEHSTENALKKETSQEIEKSQKEDAASSKKQEHSMKTNEKTVKEQKQESMKTDGKAEVNIKEMQAGDVVEDSVITQTGMEQFFYKEELTDEVFARMDGVSYPQNAQIGREELCYLHKKSSAKQLC